MKQLESVSISQSAMTGLESPTMRAQPVETDYRPLILVVTPQPFFRVSGTPIAVTQMVRALIELGYHVDLVSFPAGVRLNM
ncbi:MAG: hypothetical protein AAFW60_11590, partial [Pseudomonadota bacterium]